MELEVRIARALNELEEIYKLRYQIYSQVGYIKKEDYPDEKETDKWDKFSEHFYVWSANEKKIVGAIRLIFDSEYGFPIGELYDISFLKNKRFVEVSRRVTLPNRVKANLCLLQIICQYARKNGVTDFICSANPQDIGFYDKIGFVQFGSLQHYSKVNNPAIGMVLELDKMNEPYKALFFRPSKNILLD